MRVLRWDWGGSYPGLRGTPSSTAIAVMPKAIQGNAVKERYSTASSGPAAVTAREGALPAVQAPAGLSVTERGSEGLGPTDHDQKRR